MSTLRCNGLSCYRLLMCGILTLFLLFVASYFIALWYHTPFVALYTVAGDRIFSKAICSPEIFRDYYARRDYFPGDGRWVTASGADSTSSSGYNVSSNLASTSKSSSKSTLMDRYDPEICKFRYGGRRNPLPLRVVRQCFRAKNVSSLATMGDSNGGRHFDAIENLLLGCRKIAREKVGLTAITRVTPDVRYYARHDKKLLPYLRSIKRLCWSCVSRASRCPLEGKRQNGKWIGLEHLMLISVMDSTVTLQNKVDTYQEFVLKYYLKDRYPDLLIIFLPFNHEKYAHTIPSTERRLREFVELLDLYLPSTTRIIWIPTFAEFDSRKLRHLAYRRFEGLLSTEKIDQLNHKLYRIIRSRLLDVKNLSSSRTSRSVMAFFDQVRVSSTWQERSTDGIHMTNEWYKEMVSYILQIFCSDVIAASNNENSNT